MSGKLLPSFCHFDFATFQGMTFTKSFFVLFAQLEWQKKASNQEPGCLAESF